MKNAYKNFSLTIITKYTFLDNILLIQILFYTQTPLFQIYLNTLSEYSRKKFIVSLNATF